MTNENYVLYKVKSVLRFLLKISYTSCKLFLDKYSTLCFVTKI